MTPRTALMTHLAEAANRRRQWPTKPATPGHRASQGAISPTSGPTYPNPGHIGHNGHKRPTGPYNATEKETAS